MLARCIDDVRLVSCKHFQLRNSKLTSAMQKTERHRATVITVNLIPLGYSDSSSKFSRAFASSTGVLSTVFASGCCEALLPTEELRETGIWPFFSLSDRVFSLSTSEESLLESWLAYAVLDSFILVGVDEAALKEEKVGIFME